MKHKWKLLTPQSGPLVATTNAEVRAPMRYSTGWSIHCSECNEHLSVPYDVLDTVNTSKFIENQRKRNDCPENKK